MYIYVQLGIDSMMVLCRLASRTYQAGGSCRRLFGGGKSNDGIGIILYDEK